MPPNVPSPEECELQETIWAREAIKEGLDEKTRKIYQIIIEVGGTILMCLPQLAYSSFWF